MAGGRIKNVVSMHISTDFIGGESQWDWVTDGYITKDLNDKGVLTTLKSYTSFQK